MKVAGVRFDLDPTEKERWFSASAEVRSPARKLLMAQASRQAVEIATREQRPIHAFLYADADRYLADWMAEPMELCTEVVLRAMLDAYTPALDAALVARVNGSLLDRKLHNRRITRLLTHTIALRTAWAQYVDDPTALLIHADLSPEVVDDFNLRLKGARPLHDPLP